MLRCRAAAAFGLAAALLGSRPGAAQPVEVSLSKALALARERSPRILAARARVDEARGAVAGASPWLRENPALEVASGPRRSAFGGEGLDLSVALSQGVELGGKRGARLGAARAQLAHEGASAQDVERLTLGEVAEAFIRALHARERVALARSTLEESEQLARSARRRFEAGETPVLEANVARVALARARAEVAAQEGEELRLLGALRGLLGLPSEADLRLAGALADLAAGALPNAPRETERPDIAALEAALQEAREELRLARGEAWPDVTVGVGYEREGDEQIFLGMLTLPIPVFARGQQGRVSGEARVRRLAGELEAARRIRAVQVDAVRAQHRKQRDAVEALEREALPLLAENLTLARKSYEAGEMGLLDLLLVRRESLEARADLLERLLTAALSYADLAVQIGGVP
jgi:outer membrane protein, heavy metal efflux system